MKLNHQMEALIKAFIAMGFIETHHRVLRKEFGNLWVSIVTDYNAEFLWLQFRYNGNHDSNNALTDNYIKSIADYEQAIVDFCVEHGRMHENTRFASILKIDQYG